LRPKFIADNDLNHDIVTGLRLREPALDFWSATEGGTRDRSDPEVLAIAARGGRILVSHDRKTMIAHFYRFIEQRSSPGLIIVRQKTPIRAAIEALMLVWVASDAEEWRDQFQFATIIGSD
jgi:predicted nuclease of predicted toxin-antitoxin system